jgi:effector-binding domain-containing protein
LRFVHRGPYDDIDSTYETVTAYLDAKNIEVKDFFVEEYVSDLRACQEISA